jgi:hypothetical protein
LLLSVCCIAQGPAFHTSSAGMPHPTTLPPPGAPALRQCCTTSSHCPMVRRLIFSESQYRRRGRPLLSFFSPSCCFRYDGTTAPRTLLEASPLPTAPAS